MPRLAFTKAQGAGNDFLIVESQDLAAAGVGDTQMPQLAQRICCRRRGVGADGLEVVGPAAQLRAAAAMHLWNSDGSPAELSGNGARCVAAHLTAQGRVPVQFELETGAGLRGFSRRRGAHPEYEFRMAMPANSCRVLEAALVLTVAGRPFTVTTVDVGNPQCVCRVESLDLDWRAAGAALERHPRFPRGTNVSFVQVVSAAGGAKGLAARFWERGAGATLSSGTGALGAAVAARHAGWLQEPICVQAPGGDLVVDWGDELGLTGPVAIVASGAYELPAG